VGWGPVLAEILKLDFDVVVPGTGPTVTRADLEAFKAKVDTLVSRAAKLVKGGVSKDQLMAKTQDGRPRLAVRFHRRLRRSLLCRVITAKVSNWQFSRA